MTLYMVRWLRYLFGDDSGLLGMMLESFSLKSCLLAVAGDFLVSVVSGVRLAGAFQVASGNVAVAWLRRMASKAELFLLIRCGDRDAGGLHRELHLPRLGYVHRSTSCASSWLALLSLRYLAALCHSSRGLCLGWIGDVVGIFMESCLPKTEFFVFWD